MQQQPAASLADYVNASAWLEREPNAFFPTKSSLDWFIKSHRAELVEKGALIPGQGRAGSLVHPGRLSAAVIEIRTRPAAA